MARSNAGPRYPTKLLRELGQPLDLNDPKRRNRRAKKRPPSEDVAKGDLYEYEEGVPAEESGKNKRYDNVDKLEYELPSEFEDEEIDEDMAFGENGAGKLGSDEEIEEESGSDEGAEEEDEEEEEEEAEGVDDEDQRYHKMMQDITGRSSVHDSEGHESEMDEPPDATAVEGELTVEDLLKPLQDKPGFNALRKQMQYLDKNVAPAAVPLPKALRDKLDRKAGYEKARKDVSKWQPIVKKNREARSLNFIKREDVSLNTTASLAADFEPSNDFEKKIASLLKENGVENPEEIEAVENLELNKFSVKDVENRQANLARMRELLFRHEMKAKRIKKIKSKTFHRLLRKGQKSEPDLALEGPEQQKEETLKQELRRAEERMTLKHKNTSKWAKRILKRGLHHGKDDGTRDAIAEQLRQHSLLTRKIHSATLNSSSDDEASSSDSEQDQEQDPTASGKKVLAKAKVAMLKALDGDGGGEAALPAKGVFRMPFMMRASEMRKQEAEREATAAIEELERAQEGEDGGAGRVTSAANTTSGKLAFSGAAKRKAEKEDYEPVERASDSELSEDEEALESARSGMVEHSRPVHVSGKADQRESRSIHEMVEAAFEQQATTSQGPVSVDSRLKSKRGKRKNKQKTAMPSDAAEAPSASTSVVDTNPGIFGDDQVQDRVGEQVETGALVAIAGIPKERRSQVFESVANGAGQEEEEHSSEEENREDDEDDDDDTVLRPRSQEDLMREAFFSGGDVEEEFNQQKLATMEKEGLKKQEKDVDLPGWGQWTGNQLRKGPPKWLLDKREKAKQEEEAARKRRQDAKLKNVIISEKPDKKASKFQASSLPFPYTSEQQELFDKTMRMPIGPDFNTNQAFRQMTKPAEIKRPGVIIEPIAYEKPTVKSSGAKRKGQNTMSSGKGKKKKLL